jgi:hypothetical protein
MKSLTRVKLALAVTGVIVFGVGIRLDIPALRYTGIGFVAGAWLLRFAKDRGDN